MVIKMNDCSAHDHDQCGLFIGKDQTVEVNRFISSNNGGHGVVVDGQSDVTLNSVKSIGNGGAGFLITDTSLLNELELPLNTDLKLLKELIDQLRAAPPSARTSIINESFLSGLNNLSGIANNLLQILPNLPLP